MSIQRLIQTAAVLAAAALLPQLPACKLAGRVTGTSAAAPASAPTATEQSTAAATAAPAAHTAAPATATAEAPATAPAASTVNGRATYLDRPALAAADRQALEERAGDEHLSLAEYFSLQSSLGLEKRYAHDDVVGGVPAALLAGVESVYGTYGQDPTGHFETLTAEGGRFDQRWTQYQARLEKAAEKLHQARQLRDKGDLAGAQRLLSAAIAPIERTDSGELPRRDTLELRDAERELVLLLGEVAAARKDWQVALAASTGLAARRVPLDRESERLLWLFQKTRLTRGYATGQVPPLQDAAERLSQTFERIAREGFQNGTGYLEVLDQAGLHRISVRNAKVAKGDWVLFSLRPQRLEPARAYYHELRTWQQPYDCRRTNRIRAINPVTGELIYEEQCKYRPEKFEVEVDAKLAEPPPSWAQGSDVWFLARVVRPGKKWKLDDARIVDLRWLKEGSVDTIAIEGR